jgi:hypothetical protein
MSSGLPGSKLLGYEFPPYGRFRKFTPPRRGGDSKMLFLQRNKKVAAISRHLAELKRVTIFPAQSRLIIATTIDDSLRVRRSFPEIPTATKSRLAEQCGPRSHFPPSGPLPESIWLLDPSVQRIYVLDPA